MSPGSGSTCIAALNLPSTPRLQHAATDSTESTARIRCSKKVAYTSYSRATSSYPTSLADEVAELDSSLQNEMNDLKRRLK